LDAECCNARRFVHRFLVAFGYLNEPLVIGAKELTSIEIEGNLSVSMDHARE
jgi:hypothetical protein